MRDDESNADQRARVLALLDREDVEALNLEDWRRRGGQLEQIEATIRAATHGLVRTIKMLKKKGLVNEDEALEMLGVTFWDED